MRSYEKINKPLTNLLRKESFKWTAEAELDFNQLKEAMSIAPILALVDFSKMFVVEIDACARGIGAVLMQEGKPIAFFCKALASKHL